MSVILQHRRNKESSILENFYPLLLVLFWFLLTFLYFGTETIDCLKRLLLIFKCTSDKILLTLIRMFLLEQSDLGLYVYCAKYRLLKHQQMRVFLFVCVLLYVPVNILSKR